MGELEKRYAEMQGINYSGIPETEKEIIEWHKKIENHPIRVDEKLCEKAFLDGDESDMMTARQVCNFSRGGEIHIKMNYYASETGRSTTSGINIQGLKKGSMGRKAIIPHKGNIFVKVDSSSIEPRCLGVLADEKNILDVIKDGRDIYDEFAKTLGTERRIAKTAFLASMYGQGAKGICNYFKMNGAGITEEIANKMKQRFIKKYLKITGGYQKSNGLWQRAYEGLLANSYIKLPSGRYINYRPVASGVNSWGETEYVNLEKSGKETRLWFGRATNNLVQGTARDVFFWQVSKMVKALDGIANICWTVHDDAVFECKEKYLDITKEVLKKASCLTPIWLNGENLFVGKVACGYSYNELGE